MDLHPLPLSNRRGAVQETILSQHPSPLAGQRSDQRDPLPATSYHVSLPAIFPGGKKKRKRKARQRERLGQWLGNTDGDGGKRRGMIKTRCKGIIHPPLPSMLWYDDVSRGGDVWDEAECRPVHLSGRSELFYPLQAINEKPASRPHSDTSQECGTETAVPGDRARWRLLNGNYRRLLLRLKLKLGQRCDEQHRVEGMEGIQEINHLNNKKKKRSTSEGSRCVTCIGPVAQ